MNASSYNKGSLMMKACFYDFIRTCKQAIDRVALASYLEPQLQLRMIKVERRTQAKDYSTLYMQ